MPSSADVKRVERLLFWRMDWLLSSGDVKRVEVLLPSRIVWLSKAGRTNLVDHRRLSKTVRLCGSYIVLMRNLLVASGEERRSLCHGRFACELLRRELPRWEMSRFGLSRCGFSRWKMSICGLPRCGLSRFELVRCAPARCRSTGSAESS